MKAKYHSCKGYGVILRVKARKSRPSHLSLYNIDSLSVRQGNAKAIIRGTGDRLGSTLETEAAL